MQPSSYKKLPGSTGALRAVPGTVVEDLHLDGYEIFGGSAEAVDDPRRRPVFRRVTLRDCKARACTLEGALLDEVTVDGLVVDDDELLRVAACAFRRVVLRGAIRNLLVVPGLGVHPGHLPQLYDRANGEHWVELLSEGDWALDISEVSGSLSLRPGIPARLIRRDPLTQVVMTSEQVASGAWRAVRGIERTRLRTQIHVFGMSGCRDTVLIVDKASADLAEQVDMLRELQRTGAVLPD
ncbi:hypothetical protein [Streptomyces prunicolor]|uniref:hypothetical protein n=1 Tax=Streptomyces prunicolor TaxID=67348 RepID=UPI003438CB27